MEERLESAKAALEERVAHQIVIRNAFGLTRRERITLNLLVDGRSNKQIADILCISLPTVNSHVAKILRKMGATSRTEAATRAIKEALLT